MSKAAIDFIGVPETTGRRWYVVRTNPQCEARAEASIRRFGFETYAPVYRKLFYTRRTKKRVTRTTPFLTGYVFVLLPEVDPPFGLSRLWDGVKAFIGCQGRPIAFKDSEVEALRQMEARDWLERDASFRGRRRFRGKGLPKLTSERVVIRSGPFEGFLAAVVEHENDRTAKLLTQAFGAFEELEMRPSEFIRAA